MIVRPLARSIAMAIASGLSTTQRAPSGPSLVLDFAASYYAVQV